ncbi:hypothetical protein VTH06DRAFT_4807 [Thermothelomyces fergusii]
MGKNTDGGFKTFSHLNKVHGELLAAIQSLKSDHRTKPTRAMDEYMSAAMARSEDYSDPGYFRRPPPESDRLFRSDYAHPAGEPDCGHCSSDHVLARQPRPAADKPRIWYGTIGTADHVLRSARERDRLSREEGILCVEMEAGGMMETLPALVVRGICDYADNHKNKQWQPHAALAAAAYAKELLDHADSAAAAAAAAAGPGAACHGPHCVLGTVPLDAVQRAFAADPVRFRDEVRRLGAAVSDTRLHFARERLPLFHRFLQEHGLPRTVSSWVAAAPSSQLFGGYSIDSAVAVRQDERTDPRERLAAARAAAFLYANENFLATTYLVQDTVLRIWDYVESTAP